MTFFPKCSEHYLIIIFCNGVGFCAPRTMLGWMLKRGENAPGQGDDDTTQLEQPDTPAPVFAARAFKTALFGTPTKRPEMSRPTRKNTAVQKSDVSDTPSKPQSILVTPGTGAAKRKRVSFGNDVSGGSLATEFADTGKGTESTLSKNSPKSMHNSDDEWEEEEEEEMSHDVTLDLNEPHSQSGRYWKAEFLKYHKEARAEMEKLLKYKQLAKSYAQQRDTQAVDLAERLRDEQQKVINMEKRIAENASQIVGKKQGEACGDGNPTDLLDKLGEQTTRANQYRQRVQELESQLEEFLLNRSGGDTPSRSRRFASSPALSATQKTLTETRKELRHARSQLKQVDSLQEEIYSLKKQLKKTELRLAVSEKEEAQSRSPGGLRAQELREQLVAAREESRQKGEEIRQLQSDFEAFKRENEVHEADTKAVLSRAHTKIADLKKEVKTLKVATHPAKDDEGGQGDKATESAVASQRSTRRHSLRQQYVDDAASMKIGKGDAGSKSKRQTFVPPSPRNREALGKGITNHDHGASQASKIVAPDLPSLSPARQGRSTDGHVDLLQQRFSRLGAGQGPHINSSLVANASKGTMSSDRRAAARAKIEKRMAEKRRLRSRAGVNDKENVWPS